jgi:hypothetical protein
VCEATFIFVHLETSLPDRMITIIWWLLSIDLALMCMAQQLALTRFGSLVSGNDPAFCNDQPLSNDASKPLKELLQHPFHFLIVFTPHQISVVNFSPDQND